MRYFWLILRHKFFVLKAGLRLEVPLYLLLLHDWTKFTGQERPHYQRQFYGQADDPMGFSRAWNHHQKSNKHHWEYWIPVTGHNRGGYPDLQPLPMPQKYAFEMVADWLGASRAYEGRWPNSQGWPWWDKNKEKVLSRCHADTIKHIQGALTKLEIAVEGG